MPCGESQEPSGSLDFVRLISPPQRLRREYVVRPVLPLFDKLRSLVAELATLLLIPVDHLDTLSYLNLKSARRSMRSISE